MTTGKGTTEPVKTSFEERFWHSGHWYRVTFLDGHELAGKLVGVDRYNVTLRVIEEQEADDVLCFKHAMCRARALRRGPVDGA